MALKDLAPQKLVIKKTRISQGGISSTIVDQRLIFKEALENYSSGLILVHNHPTGQLKPSNEDINLTIKIKEAGRLMDIPVLDHIIFTNNTYFSFQDNGLM